ncbi:hypothetical protein [uncultured Pseudoteredinibacter sp.]|uniref:hypothetical protein n=1 Tax=uncultured Pseudoteredinibacter sp. TaxID=1641701 RepID=UPI002613BBB3|nr:hypothetical protein [uncultured Pseudoteredinibacter sp.]
MNRRVVVNFEAIVNNLRAFSPDMSQQRINKLSQALETIQKRNLMCQYYYSELYDFINSDFGLLKDRLSHSGQDEIGYRVFYESHFFGFIYTLHALVDSLPYMLNIALHPIYANFSIENRSVGWKDCFLEQYAPSSLGPCLRSFREIDEFEELKRICNSAKHRLPGRIANTGTSLEFFYQYSGDEQREPVLDLINRLHDVLLTAVVELVETLIEFQSQSFKNRALHH